MKLLPRSRRGRVGVVSVGLLAVMTVAGWCDWYRPWEPHYLGHPARWWAAWVCDPEGREPRPRVEELWEELWEELVSPTFEDDNKVVKIEPKEDIKSRLGRSPNKADAFVMANWVRERAIPAVRPSERVLRENESPGYDYARQRPRDRETGPRCGMSRFA